MQTYRKLVIALLSLAAGLDTGLSQTVSGVKVTSSSQCLAPFQWCNDAIQTRYIITVGKGFDPSQNYINLNANIRRTAHAGGTTFYPNGEADGNDAPSFQVIGGVIGSGGTPGNIFTGTKGSPGRISNEGLTDTWTWIGDGNLYNTQGEIVGYISDVSASADIVPQCFGASCTTKILAIKFTVNYGPRKDDCETCQTGVCPPGGPQANLHSIDVKFSLGKGNFGGMTGWLGLKSELPNQALSRPRGLFAISDSRFEIITNANGYRQILSPQVLANIVTNNSYKYDIQFFPAAQAGSKTNGLYAPTNTPYRMVTVENPNASTNYNRLFITDVQDGVTNITKYVYDTTTNTWTFEAYNGLRRETLSRTWNSNNTERTELKTVWQPSGSSNIVVYQEQKKFRTLPWGSDELVQLIVDPNGAQLTTAWEYYTNSTESGKYTQLKQRTDPNGYWERYEYDTSFRLTNKVMSYLNATNGAPTSQCRQLTISYSSSNPRETHVETLLGQEVARRYRAYYANVVQEIVCQTTGAVWTAANNLITTTTNYPAGAAFAGEPKSISNPDGTMVFYFYSTNATYRTNIVCVGQPTSNKTNILAGTKTVTVVGYQGETISRTNCDVVGGTNGIVLSRELYTYSGGDDFKRSPTITHLDGAQTQIQSDCCGVASKTEKDGSITSYLYDNQKRQVGSTSVYQGIATTNLLDTTGRVLRSVRLGSDGSAITNYTAGYDTAGRLTAETNALNSPTLYTNWFDGSGQLVKHTTFADGGTRVATYYRDGQLQSVKGTAVAPVRYAYGVTSEGGLQRVYSAEIKLDASYADTLECATNFVDMVGRTYKTVSSAASGSPSAISYFNTKGQLTNRVDMDGVSTLYGYNPKAELAYSIVDSNRDYTIDWSGNDRIAYVTNDVVNNGTTDVRRSRTYVWDSSANASNLISTVEVSADGLRSWNTVWNGGASITSQSRIVFDAANGYRYLTNIAPDNSYSVSVTRYSTNVSSTAYDSAGGQLGRTTYAYDAHGRLCQITDARTGTMTNYFNSADQLSGVATPIPGSGLSSQVTTNYFDVMGRVWKTTLPDDTSITNNYDVTGLLTNTFGSRTYPVAYTYDAQGRMKSMKTWKDFANDSGAAITTWNYDIYRGWLTNKTYDGGAAGPVYTYTAAGRLATRLWARGTNTIYTYNNAGDLVRVDYSDSTSDIGYGYDRLGRQLTVTNDSALVCTFAYNGLGQMLSETYSSGPLSGLSITNGYDSLLRRSAVGLSNYSGVVTTYAYDNASRLAWVTNGANTVNYAYLANSPLVDNLTFRQGGTTRMTTVKAYDNLNRLLSITNQPSADSAIGYRYAYNTANQRTSVTNAERARWVYTYDALGQVTSGKKYWSDGTPVAGQQFEYTFDDIGNRKTMASGGDAAGANLRLASYTNNALNQITSRGVPGYVDVQGSATNTATVTVNNQATYRHNDYFRAELTATNTSPLWFGVTNVAVLNNGTNADIVASTTGFVFVAQSPEVFSYDADGNMTNDGRWLLTWDAENRLLKAESLASTPTASKRKVEWSYDYQGRRVRQTTSDGSSGSYVVVEDLKFLSDGWRNIAELNATNNALVRSYVWGLDWSGSLDGAGGVGGLLMLNSVANGTHFYACDGNGNVTALIQANDGTASANYEYEGFGKVLRATGPMADENRFQFSTKRCDRTTDFELYEYRVRRTDATWLSRDPLEEQGGLNLHGFVGNNALNYYDPVGLFNPISGPNGPIGSGSGLPNPVIFLPPNLSSPRNPRPVNQVVNPMDMFLFYFLGGGNSAVLSPQIMNTVVNSQEVISFQSDLERSAKSLMCNTPCGQKGHYTSVPHVDEDYYPISPFFTGKWQLYLTGRIDWHSKSDGKGGCIVSARGSINGYASKTYMFEKISAGNPANWTTTYLFPFPSIAYPLGGGPYLISGDISTDFEFTYVCPCKNPE